MQPQSPSPQGAGPGGAGAPPAGGGAPGGAPEQSADQSGAQLQQLAQQYISQGRPPELAQQGMDMLCQMMGLDGQQADPNAGGGAPGASAGGPAGGPPGGGSPAGGGAPAMKKGGKLQSFKSKDKKAAPPAKTGLVPEIKLPVKK